MVFEVFERLTKDKKETILNAGIKEFSTYSYRDANTDRITTTCGISKGLLYHYFGTKKNFYIYCIRYAMDTLTAYETPVQERNFYDILFTEMEQKILLCINHPAETKFINLVSRESAKEVVKEKNELLGHYAIQMKQRSQGIFTVAMDTLNLKEPRQKAIEALHIYSNAVINRYMMQYQNSPDDFFEKQDEIKIEIKQYLDMMLYGICIKENKK